MPETCATCAAVPNRPVVYAAAAGTPEITLYLPSLWVELTLMPAVTSRVSDATPAVAAQLMHSDNVPGANNDTPAP
jgi:hypothetical protein